MAKDVLQPGAPWSPTAQNFVQHQLAQVMNFWQQGRQATFCLDALPSGTAELKVTFKLPQPGDVLPPPQPPPLFSPAPKVCPMPVFPVRSSPCYQGKPKLSNKRRKSYRRAVLHRAALAAVSRPPPLPGSLQEACVKVLGGMPPPSADATASLVPEIDPSSNPSALTGDSTSDPDPALFRASTSGVNKTEECEVTSKTDPLPLCHYCCHRGSGDYPVHYFMQCMCDDKDCSCKCYCSGAQLEHKHRVFPARFRNGEPMDPCEVPKAKVIADERTERFRGYCPTCDNPLCVKDMKEDGLCLT